MKVYKGTDKDIKCRGYQFTPGVEAVEESAELCSSGFHACLAPLDVFRYYPPSEGNRFFEAELEDVSNERHSDDTKVCGKRIKLGAEIGIPGFVKAQVEYVKANTTMERTDPKMATAGSYGAATAGFRGAATAGSYGAATAGSSGAATAGSYGAATAGFRGAATAGFRGAATAGSYGAATADSYGAATAGSYGAATAGPSGAATAGSYGAATAGSYGAATAGSYGAATAGSSGAATSRGSVSLGKNGCGLVRGNGVKARGGIGSILVICIERDNSYEIEEWKVAVVDGETIKADTWYTLKNGEFVEVE